MGQGCADMLDAHLVQSGLGRQIYASFSSKPDFDGKDLTLDDLFLIHPSSGLKNCKFYEQADLSRNGHLLMIDFLLVG